MRWLMFLTSLPPTPTRHRVGAQAAAHGRRQTHDRRFALRAVAEPSVLASRREGRPRS